LGGGGGILKFKEREALKKLERLQNKIGNTGHDKRRKLKGKVK
jgi:hypothetical protein